MNKLVLGTFIFQQSSVNQIFLSGLSFLISFNESEYQNDIHHQVHLHKCY